MFQRFVVCVGILLLLAGCGFRPAGTLDSSALQGTRVIDATPGGSSELVWNLRQDMKLRGVPPAEDIEDAQVLRVIAETWERRPLSLTAGARTAEYELVGRADFELLRRDGSVLIPARSVRAESVYLRDPERLLGSSQEEARLRTEIQTELVRRILTAVAAVSAD